MKLEVDITCPGCEHKFKVALAKMKKKCGVEAILKQRDPRLLGGHAIAAAQRVAHHDDGLTGCECRQGENRRQEQRCQAFEHEHSRLPIARRGPNEKG